MPLPIIAQAVVKGIDSIPYGEGILKAALFVALIGLLKRYFGGTVCKADHVMHSKVIMVTGGISGIGEWVVRELATRGAQIILLTRHPPSDPFLVDQIEDLRRSTRNAMIYAEQCDLSSLHSIRLFATKWIDNTPVRRLDMILLIANTINTLRPPAVTLDGLNEEWQINYLANFHLLSILSPAIRSQPPDRDVRVIFATCPSYIGATLDFDTLEARTQPPLTKDDTESTKKKPTLKRKTSSGLIIRTSNMYSTSKLALMIFASSFQAHLSAFQRPDKHECNAQVHVVDPGLCRTPGTRRWMTGGSLIGLLVYLLTWPIWWLVLKSPQQGAQSFLTSIMETGFSAAAVNAATVTQKMGIPQEETRGLVSGLGISGKRLIKECKEREILRREVADVEQGRLLWEFSEKQIEQKEKQAAILRALEQKERKNWEAEKKKEEGVNTENGDAFSSGNKPKDPGSRRARKVN